MIHQHTTTDNTVQELASQVMDGDQFVDAVEEAMESRLTGVARKMQLKAAVSESRLKAAARVAEVALRSDTITAIGTIVDAQIEHFQAIADSAPEGSRKQKNALKAIERLNASCDQAEEQLEKPVLHIADESRKLYERDGSRFIEAS